MKKFFLLLLLGALTSIFSGCYNSSRSTDAFYEFPEVTNLPSGVVDKSGFTDEDKRRQLEFLKQLDAE